MIDSICFRLNNIWKYPGFLQHLMNESSVNICEAFAKVDENKNALFFRLQTKQFETFGEKHLQMKGEKLTSSHYYLGYSVPLGKNATYVEFNFSIPKLLYGTNILQFVQHSTENSVLIDNFFQAQYDWNVNNTYKRLRKFFSQFFNKYFDYVWESYPSYEDIEIRRFDISWNQLFNSKAEAMEYLSFQQQIKKPFTRENKRGKHSYDTSVFFSTRDYGCKIYHKGSEYKSSKGERKHHSEINRDNGKQIFNIPVLQEMADRILRYEITFRSAYMSKIYRSKVFRCNSPEWQKKMKKFRRLKRIYQYANSKTLSEERRKIYSALWNGEIIEGFIPVKKEDRAFYEWWAKVKERRIAFTLEVDKHTQKLNEGIGLYDLGLENDLADYRKHGFARIPEVCRFDKHFLLRCFSVFREFKDHFKVREQAYLSDTAKKVKEYNERIKVFNDYHKINGIAKPFILEGNVKKVLFLLQNHSLDYLVKNDLIHRSTANRYMKKFKLLDINFRGGSDVNIPTCPGFEWYHELCSNPEIEKYLKWNRIFL